MKLRGGYNTHICTPATARDKDFGEVDAETSSDFTENHAAVYTCMPVLIFNSGL